MSRQNSKETIYSGAPWEKIVAYSRLKKIGNHIYVSGTTSVDKNGDVVGEGDVYLQCKQIFNIIADSLSKVGSSMKDVVRTRTFITDVTKFDDFAKAHAETFTGIDPVATCVEVSRLVNDKLLVEIEVDAVMTQ